MKIAVNEQVYLSDILPSDRAACVDFLNEREIYDRTLRIPYPYRESDFDAWLQIVEKSTQEQGRMVHFAIRLANGSFIGGLGFDGIQLNFAQRAEIGYWLAKPYWGRGIMTAAVRAASALAFAELGMTKLTAHIFPGNAASARVLEKCGFEKEGYLRQHFIKDGKHLDAVAYGLVRSATSDSAV
jgi:[ribosomal protein S5]-alanine N-acetyltransferase